MALVGDSYEYYDKRFYDLTVPIAEVEELFDGCRWAEGPVWFNDGGYLVWSDIPNQRLLRWIDGQGVSVFRHESNYANGNTRDRQGRLVSCEHGTRRVTRTEADGSITVIADSYEGKRLNSPNDVVVKSDGTIWFTDPNYGIMSDYEGYKTGHGAGRMQRLLLRSGDRRDLNRRRRLRQAERTSILAGRKDSLHRRQRPQPRSGRTASYPRFRRGGRRLL